MFSHPPFAIDLVCHTNKHASIHIL